MNPNEVPAAPAPNGAESNLINPYSQQPILVAITTVTLVISLSAIAARSYTRVVITKQFDFTDYILLLGGGLFVAFASVQIVAGEYGQGRHLWNVPAADFAELLLYLNIIGIIYSPTMFCTKYVVLRQIETIFLSHQRKKFAFTLIRVLIWANFFSFAGIFLSFILACVPREKIYHPNVDGRCINTDASIIATSAVNVVSDFSILMVPTIAIWQLQLPLKAKLGVATVFGIGIIANVTSIARLYYSIQLTRTIDITWDIIPVAEWALGEFTAVIVMACCPHFPHLARHLFGRDRRPIYRIPSINNAIGSKKFAALRTRAPNHRDIVTELRSFQEPGEDRRTEETLRHPGWAHTRAYASRG
ncbi:hypothetical protein F4824DRAFT_497252 [Ustulina deusta]|nr:hypothetical protein F4824DRAFT_497252 [Ustulina deusta]